MKILINGCFDLLHDGHKYILSKALEWAGNGHVLILLNSDVSVSSLKGPGRPVEPFYRRKTAIEAFKAQWCLQHFEYPRTDIVEFNTEDQLSSLIDNFQPDLILKGNDRPDVRDIIGSVNWPVCILPRIKDQDGEDISTTRIIKGDQIGQEIDFE